MGCKETCFRASGSLCPSGRELSGTSPMVTPLFSLPYLHGTCFGHHCILLVSLRYILHHYIRRLISAARQMLLGIHLLGDWIVYLPGLVSSLCSLPKTAPRTPCPSAPSRRAPGPPPLKGSIVPNISACDEDVLMYNLWQYLVALLGWVS